VTSLEELRARAADGLLSPEEIHLIAGHLGAEHDPRVRRLALDVAALQLAHTEDAELIVQLVAMGEDKRPEHEDLRADAVRLLARATEYHGQPVRLDLQP
jgi:hypothetical protein